VRVFCAPTRANYTHRKNTQFLVLEGISAKRVAQNEDRRPKTEDRRPLSRLVRFFALAVGLSLVGLAALPARAQLLIELPNPNDKEELSASIGTWDDGLEILGLGTAVLDDYAPDFFGDVIIRGAQLTLKANGRLGDASYIEITNGGRLFLDNRDAAHSDRLGDSAPIALYAGTIAFDPGDFGYLTQEVGNIYLDGGANQIDLHLGSAAGGLLLAETLLRDFDFISTLNIRYLEAGGSSAPTNVHFALKDGSPIEAVLGILSWATITRGSQVDWVEWEEGVSTVFNPLSNYHTGDPANWHAQDHVLVDGGTASLIYNGSDIGFTQISSLKLANSATLSLTGTGNWQALELLSGGLLSTGANDRIQGVGTIGSGNDARGVFYIHVHGGNLTVSGSINLVAGSAMVKTGGGTLRLNDDVYMSGGALVIHQGTVAFEEGFGMSFPIVRIGDGTGTDVLKLPANHIDPIQYGSRRRMPQIFLHGTPYSTTPDSGASDAAILRFGGGTVQNAALLNVEGRGTLDFDGGTESAPNMLYLEEFTLADFDTTILFIRHWEDKHDFLLVRRSAANINRIDADFLARINFEGYDAPAQWVYWSDEYWEIKPMPEPSTYGTILGAVGLGLFICAKRRTAKRIRIKKRTL